MDTHPDLEWLPQGLTQLLHDLEPGADRTVRVIFMSGGSAEDGHDTVATELRDGPAIACDHLAHRRDRGPYQLAPILGIHLLG